MSLPNSTLPRLSEAEVLSGCLKAAPRLGVELDRQNTGAMKNASGRLVRYGKKGNSDLTGMTGPSWGWLAGIKLDVECKREDWKQPRPPKPGKLPGEARKRWEAQLHRLRTTNANGGFGFWTDHPASFAEILLLLKTGRYRIEIGADEETTLVPREGED